jgi:hypothetical protein
MMPNCRGALEMRAGNQSMAGWQYHSTRSMVLILFISLRSGNGRGNRFVEFLSNLGKLIRCAHGDSMNGLAAIGHPFDLIANVIDSRNFDENASVSILLT